MARGAAMCTLQKISRHKNEHNGGDGGNRRNRGNAWEERVFLSLRLSLSLAFEFALEFTEWSALHNSSSPQS